MALLTIPPSAPISKATLVSYSGPGYPVVLLGDSITQNNYLAGTITAISRASGIGSATFSGTQNLWPGAQVGIVNVQNSPTAPSGLPMEGNFNIIDNPSGNTWRYTDNRPDVAVGVLGTFPRGINWQTPTDNGYFTMLNAFCLGKFDVLGVSAATGRYTADILAHAPEVFGLGAKFAFVLGGTNDATSTGASAPYGDVSAATMIANLDATYKLLASQGMEVVAVTIPPLGSGAWTAAATKKITVTNIWIKNRVAQTKGMRLFDYHRWLVDAANANKGQAKTAYTAGVDSIHPSPLGAGYAAFNEEPNWRDLPLIDRRVMSPADAVATEQAVPDATTSDNVQLYSPWTGTGGTINANVLGAAFPAKWVATKLGTTSLITTVSAAARSDGYGYDCVAAIIPQVAGDGIQIDTGSYTFHPSVTVGKSMQVGFTITAAGMASAKLKGPIAFVALAFTVNAISYSNKGLYAINAVGVDGECINFDYTAVFRSPRVLFQYQPTSALFRTQFTATASSGGNTGTINVGRNAVRVN